MFLRRLLSLAVFSLVVTTTSGILAKPPEDAVKAIVRATTGMEMLAKGQFLKSPGTVPSNLLNSVKGKRLVGLGEGSHGTSEVFTMIGNTVLAMAKQGKIVVFWEDNFASTQLINNWIHGAGAESDLIGIMKKTVYRIRYTTEVADFLKAARRFNASVSPGQRIDIYGVDPTMVGGIPGEASTSDVTIPLKEYSDTNNLGLDSQIAVCSAYLNDPDSFTPEVRTAAAAASLAIQRKITDLGAGVGGKVEALVMANSLVAQLQMDTAAFNTFGEVYLDALGTTPSTPVFNGIRDASMAENIKQLMDAKVPEPGIGIYWSHNGHVARTSYLFGAGSPIAWATTGSILGLWLGDQYVAVGTLVWQGTFRTQVVNLDGSWGGFQTVTAPPINPDSLNAIAAAVSNGKVMYLPLSSCSFNWVVRPELAVGSMVDLSVVSSLIVGSLPGMAYDAVISFPHSKAAVALPL